MIVLCAHFLESQDFFLHLCVFNVHGATLSFFFFFLFCCCKGRICMRCGCREVRGRGGGGVVAVTNSARIYSECGGERNSEIT